MRRPHRRTPGAVPHDGGRTDVPVAHRSAAATLIPDGRPFPTALDPFSCNRYELGAFASRRPRRSVSTTSACAAGPAPHHIRSVAEALGRTPPASRFSADMSRHAYFGTDERLKAATGSSPASCNCSCSARKLSERVSPIDRAQLGCAAMAEFPPLDGSAPRKRQFSSPPDLGIDPNKRYTATLDTSLGEIVIALDAVKAPQTVNNFVFLAAHHYYDGVIFHRIINGFMCQGGDPTGTGRGGPGYKFADELPKAGQYQIGSVAMANAGPNTNGSQFFLISGADGVRLPPQYSLFGQIVKGLDVLDQMQAVKTGGGDRPVEDVVINSVTITESD